MHNGATFNACPARPERVKPFDSVRRASLMAGESKGVSEAEVPMTRGLIAVASLALGAITFGQTRADGQSIERSFAEGGIVTLHLSSGDYTVRAGASDRVRVEWRAEDAHEEKKMKDINVVTDIFERVMTIRTKGPTTHARFTIEIPSRTDIHLRVRAGDVRIEGIEGHKNVRMTAGDLHIEVAPGSLRHVHASVTFGDLTAHSLGIDKDGIKNSFDWFGEGRYTLDARLFAGDVTLQ
jgi:hypothetical protein